MVRAVPSKRTTIVPDGEYDATLTAVRQFENSYGDRIGFEFTLDDGLRVMRSTSTNLSPKSKLAEVVRSLLGRELTEEEISNGIDLEQFVGTECIVDVLRRVNRSGVAFSSVEQVTKRPRVPKGGEDERASTGI